MEAAKITNDLYKQYLDEKEAKESVQKEVYDLKNQFKDLFEKVGKIIEKNEGLEKDILSRDQKLNQMQDAFNQMKLDNENIVKENYLKDKRIEKLELDIEKSKIEKNRFQQILGEKTYKTLNSACGKLIPSLLTIVGIASLAVEAAEIIEKNQVVKLPPNLKIGFIAPDFVPSLIETAKLTVKLIEKN